MTLQAILVQKEICTGEEIEKLTQEFIKCQQAELEKKMKEVKSLYKNYVYIPYETNPKVNIICRLDNDLSCDWFINEGYHSYKYINSITIIHYRNIFSKKLTIF